MDKTWNRLIFGLEKKYSVPILFLLYSKRELSFGQIYDFCSQYKAVNEKRQNSGVLREHGRSYKAISRESISRATAELQMKKYIKKTAKISKKGRPQAVYTLTDETKQLMNKHLK